MPPYTRDIPASAMIASSRSRSLGNASARTVIIALVMHECPDGYDGWFGSPIGSVMAGSACEGRMNQYVSFASQQAICASNAAAWAYARMRADSSSVRWAARIISSAMTLRLAAVNGPAPVFQWTGTASCCAVGVSEIARTSASAARNSADPNAGGGGGRSWLGELRKNG